MSIFKCSLCSQKDEHITSLKKQIQMLEKLVLPTRPTQDITLEEVDAIYSHSDTIIIPDTPEIDEAGMLLSGDFGRIPNEEF